jgi:hypothetical protein
MSTEFRIVTSRPIRQRRPTTLFSIVTPGSITQPSAIRLPVILAPSIRDGGRNRGRV